MEALGSPTSVKHRNTNIRLQDQVFLFVLSLCSTLVQSGFMYIILSHSLMQKAIFHGLWISSVKGKAPATQICKPSSSGMLFISIRALSLSDNSERKSQCVVKTNTPYGSIQSFIFLLSHDFCIAVHLFGVFVSKMQLCCICDVALPLLCLTCCTINSLNRNMCFRATCFQSLSVNSSVNKGLRVKESRWW